MPTPTLSRGAVRSIRVVVDRLFAQIKGRLLGPDFVASRGDKNIFVGFKPELSLPGIYRTAATEESARPDETVLNGLVRVAESYLDAQREQVKARVVNSVNSWLATSKGSANVETVLGGELAPVWKQMTDGVTKIVDSEATKARNIGTLEGISKINALANVADPVVFFVVVRDKEFWDCKECPKIHLLPDGITPRVWLLSEVSGGYHQRGEDRPSVSGLHPHCRCTIANLLRGYGFNAAGAVRFVALDHDEISAQRGG